MQVNWDIVQLVEVIKAMVGTILLLIVLLSGDLRKCIRLGYVGVRISLILDYSPHNCAGSCTFFLIDYIIIYL